MPSSGEQPGDWRSAIDAGIVLPDELEDPFRPMDASRPDIGALPRRAGMLAGGRPENTKSVPETQE
ncbi:hypothetical protein [Planctomycetes bacterium CA13]|uniref:hypothetical protein n=1 Tax=Novipirellula herctigrandis TaxID=2527986 RepID=UPI0011B3A5BF